ncbi:MAG: aminotransferase DegT [Candidatus Scalindua rubra]|uniref:Aminotransferase DegT n=1 Tax=Candidatus Scalindua rubra TaxID=1872076 RepID=A0A1E3X5E2_9BACT|nr:MAG: aminotransferase DegT [Candidatus Scalindua rubra]
MNIPLVDLKSQYQLLKHEIDSAIHHVIDETAFINGKYVQTFENEFAKAYGVKYCISCGNGTDAIYIILKSIGIGQGDEVITVANTWISTAETITQAGAKPVFVDIHPYYYNINTELIEKKINDKTKAIITVHLFGQPANMDVIQELCQKHSLLLIEDCAQAHFAEWNKRKVGTFGIAGSFSFYPGKNLGAYGDAGAIITNDDSFAERVRMFANHGALQKHNHIIEGVNSRLDGLQAAILSVKLPHIYAWNKRRQNNALLYNKLLNEIDLITIPKIDPRVSHVFHLYVVRTPHRDELQVFLKERGIATGIHYPTPLPFLKAYKYLNHSPDNFPIAYLYKDHILSLPMFPELTENQIGYICDSINEFFKT